MEQGNGEGMIVACATFDNPTTMARELWRDGVLVGKTTAELLLSAAFRGHHDWHFGFNVGAWEPGQVRGDFNATRTNGKRK